MFTVFVPLARMPLNPNGKVDKPALPFPDTVQITSREAKDSADGSTPMSATENVIQNIWRSLLPSAPEPIGLDDNFFDLGGHSILATRLVFELRKSMAVDAPLGLVFDRPTIRELASGIDELRNSDLGFVWKPKDAQAQVAMPNAAANADANYAEDLDRLILSLEKSYRPLDADFGKKPLTVFLTGATGFLGAFILNDLLSRKERVGKVICLVRAKDANDALNRIQEGTRQRGLWDDGWLKEGRVALVIGDLDQENLGLDAKTWAQVAEEADAILHNGAWVHWVYPYERLRSANVLSTLAIIKLASIGRPKAITFVSSTAAIENEHYVRLSDQLVNQGGLGVPENDDLEGARVGLPTGYGQSKWVSEKLLMAAGNRGLTGCIVRPGYVVGSSQSAGMSHLFIYFWTS